MQVIYIDPLLNHVFVFFLSPSCRCPQQPCNNAMPSSLLGPVNRAAPLPSKPPQQSKPQQQQLQSQQPPQPQHTSLLTCCILPSKSASGPLSPPTLTPQGLLSSQPPQMLLEDDEEPVPSMPLPMYLQQLQPNRLQQQPPTSLMQSLQSRPQQPGQQSLLQSVQVQSQMSQQSSLPPPQIPVQTQAQPSPQISQHQARPHAALAAAELLKAWCRPRKRSLVNTKSPCPPRKHSRYPAAATTASLSPRQHKSDSYKLR